MSAYDTPRQRFFGRPDRNGGAVPIALFLLHPLLVAAVFEATNRLGGALRIYSLAYAAFTTTVCVLLTAARDDRFTVGLLAVGITAAPHADWQFGRS